MEGKFRHGKSEGKFRRGGGPYLPFADAATGGAPQAQQVADRFHLQQNLTEALKRFFQHNAHVLKTTARLFAGNMLPVPTSPAAEHIE